MNRIKASLVGLCMIACAGGGFFFGKRSETSIRIQKSEKVVVSKHIEPSGLSTASNIKWVSNDDGSQTVYELQPEKKILIKRALNHDGAINHVASYWFNPEGVIIGCSIADSDGVPIHKVLFGYRKSDGKLVRELVFNAGTKPPINKASTICRVDYFTNSKGDRAAVKLWPDQSLQGEGLLGIPSALCENPFADRF